MTTSPDTEAERSRGRFDRGVGCLVYLVSILLAGVGVYVAGIGVLDETHLRVGTFGIAGLLLLLHAIERRRVQSWPVLRRLLDTLLLVALLVAIHRYLQIGEMLQVGLYAFTTQDLAIGAVGLVVLLEMTRRAIGWPLLVICVLMVLYGLYGQHLPWIFEHAGMSFRQLMQVTWYSFDGVFGNPIAIVVSMILIYVVFGSMLEGIGAGDVLLKFAFALTGRLRGGPAHSAIAASGAFGTMSGSVAGNVVGTGVITIPMIRNRGFPASYAGGLEAAASSGGQFMPPVMGAVAFIMADVTGIPYLTIATAALVPALFYYLALFTAVHLEAVKRDIKPIPKAERPHLTLHDYLMSLCFLVPLGVVVTLLIAGRSPAFAGFYAVITAVVLGILLNPQVRQNPRCLVDALYAAGISSAKIIVAVGAIGILIGVMNATGLGLRFANTIMAVAGDSLFLALIMMMLGSLVLGMGMPTVPAYLIIVLVMGPAIEQMGVATLIVHLFVVYFGVLSSITPPVALAAFVAAPIANANPMRISVDACRLALIGFIIPFVLVYNPSLSLVEAFQWDSFLWAVARLTLAIWLFSSAVSGYAAAHLGAVSRTIRLAIGFSILVPVVWIEALGFALGALLLAGDFLQSRKAGGQWNALVNKRTDLSQ
ncbi:TRAP transporter permease [Halomonas salipaludis]|uniref:TRAP C4-dicarboxylate transport system permease DctM subunit domain-containing protein n=1 Tax=Halomonas salipaludis TaxID=2032625 RepID=A0A2A2ER36_9GAMM|nr:TRAP transporter fused permease subunit [Halomonas salipaludis]PAU74822.1 hypothetical protein CK498_19870 [Halomonas salipaludis]